MSTGTLTIVDLVKNETIQCRQTFTEINLPLTKEQYKK